MSPESTAFSSPDLCNDEHARLTGKDSRFWILNSGLRTLD